MEISMDVMAIARMLYLKDVYARCFPMAWLTAPEHNVEEICLN